MTTNDANPSAPPEHARAELDKWERCARLHLGYCFARDKENRRVNDENELLRDLLLKATLAMCEMSDGLPLKYQHTHQTLKTFIACEELSRSLVGNKEYEAMTTENDGMI